MRVLGIDPGLSRCGVGVVEGTRSRAQVVRVGVIRSDPDEAVPLRLRHLHEELQQLLAETQPQAVAIERTFFTVNVRTAMGVGQAAGVAMLAAAQAGISTFEYTPTRMKAVVAGSGTADKHQIAYMVRTHLRLAHAPTPPDASDALALALCHLWETQGHNATPGGMSPRLRAALETAAPGAQVVRVPKSGVTTRPPARSTTRGGEGPGSAP